MSRPAHIWIGFSLCLAVLLAAMGWASLTVLRLDRVEAHAQQQAEFEERTRLALWRMDSSLTPLMVEESARPYFAYKPFATDRAYTKSSVQQEVLIPSPLLNFSSSNVLLHFQFDAEGRIVSPQVPVGKERELAEAGHASRENIELAAARLAELRQILNQETSQSLASVAPRSSAYRSSAPLEAPERSLKNRDLLANTCAVPATNAVPTISINNALQAAAPQQQAQLPLAQMDRQSRQSQGLRNFAEWNARANVYQQVAGNDKASGNYDLPPGLNLNEGPIKPVWLGSTLVLVRRVALERTVYVQGCWLNWTNLKQSLLANVRDLFPTADLQPLLDPNGDKDARMLAFLPVKFLTPSLVLAPLSFWSPLRVSLAVAWACVLLAGLAVAVLLHGTVSLSERRGAFVSAVTHELRTPLTTFKMYSEMLAEDMVPDLARKKQYLQTLCSEANRLSHLVENVLAYARLERGSARGRVERVSLRDLIDRVQSRLVQRAGQADMDLVVDGEENALAIAVHVDVSAVEQILFNLVDNACKYAAPGASEKIIHLEALPSGKFAMLRVRDHGQGISEQGARRLFQPFSKSAHEAAHSAPGVGLGLALCRRLSRSMGGDLRLDRLVQGGACFVLTLPTTQSDQVASPASIA
jgi:signal transduction histidine kinase